MFNTVCSSENQVDFMDRVDVQRFQEVATSVLKSAFCVAAVALVVLAVFGGVALTIAAFTFGCIGLAGPVVLALEGVELILGSITVGIGTIGMIGICFKVIGLTFEQCKEAHQLIWG